MTPPKRGGATYGYVDPISEEEYLWQAVTYPRNQATPTWPNVQSRSESTPATNRQGSSFSGLVIHLQSPHQTRQQLANQTQVIADEPAELNRISQELFGYPLSAEDYAALVAAPPQSKVSVRPNWDQGAIRISVAHPLYQRQEREIYRNRKGELELHHTAWKVAPDAPKGTGCQKFLEALNAALKYKIDLITTEAAGSPAKAFANRSGWNGYITWPKFGYNAPLKKSTRDRLPPQFQSAKSLNQLFLLPGGAEWWEQHGQGGNMVFRLKPGSSSFKVFQNYLKKKTEQHQLHKPPKTK